MDKDTIYLETLPNVKVEVQHETYRTLKSKIEKLPYSIFGQTVNSSPVMIPILKVIKGVFCPNYKGNPVLRYLCRQMTTDDNNTRSVTCIVYMSCDMRLFRVLVERKPSLIPFVTDVPTVRFTRTGIYSSS